MKKLLGLILVLTLCAFCLCGCDAVTSLLESFMGGEGEGTGNEGSNDSGEEEGEGKDEGEDEGNADNSKPDKEEEKIDYGTMTIEAPAHLYTNYAGGEIKVIFSKPEYATDVTFTCSSTDVVIENGMIYARGSFPTLKKVVIAAHSDKHPSATAMIEVEDFKGGAGNIETNCAYYDESVIPEIEEGSLIFVGDSYFSGYKKEYPPFWHDFYTDYEGESAYLLGISQSGVADWEVCSERLVYPLNPSEIVVHIGFNDVHHGNYTPNELTDRIIALLEQYHERLPEAKVYFCSIEPKKNAKLADDYRESSLVVAPAINASIAELAEGSDWLTFVDTTPLCYNADGSINTKFYLATDLSHPTTDAYDKYKALIDAARGKITEKEA